jgi:hypothetical protein
MCEELFVCLQSILRSLATRVPRIILQRVSWCSANDDSVGARFHFRIEHRISVFLLMRSIKVPQLRHSRPNTNLYQYMSCGSLWSGVRWASLRFRCFASAFHCGQPLELTSSFRAIFACKHAAPVSNCISWWSCCYCSVHWGALTVRIDVAQYCIIAFLTIGRPPCISLFHRLFSEISKAGLTQVISCCWYSSRMWPQMGRSACLFHVSLWL